MKALAFFLLTACSALMTPVVVAQESEQPTMIEGEARQLPGKRLIYRETHRVSGLFHQIDYYAPTGDLIASTTLDYRCSQTAPAFEQHDLDAGTRLGAFWKDGYYWLRHDQQSQSIEVTGSLVASSGFDHFVRQQWQALTQRKTVAFDFALPARLQTLRMRIRQIDPDDVHSAATHWFSVEPANSLLRLLVDPIVLGYDDAQRLALYRGISNLSERSGSTPRVEIRYVYPAMNEARVAKNSHSSAVPDAEPVGAAQRTSSQSTCEPKPS